jgi:hypothetical protein
MKYSPIFIVKRYSSTKNIYVESDETRAGGIS